MAYYSPLRYPGGKGKMYTQTLEILTNNNLLGCTYIEAFAGGANLALNFLMILTQQYIPYGQQS